MATIYVDIDNHADNPLARALKAVAFGAEPVEQLAHGDVEVDIAVTNSVGTALRMVKETERTSIVLVYFDRRQREGAIAFASRYPNRVTAVAGVGRGEGEMEILPFLLELIADKAKGV